MPSNVRRATQSFLEKIKSDISLQEWLNGDADAVVEIAKEAGVSIAAEDIRSMQSSTVELSDEELEGLAGGRVATPGATGVRTCHRETCHRGHGYRCG